MERSHDEAGLLFIDFENCSGGPVEFDLAWVPTDVSGLYRDADQQLVNQCRALILALIAAHRWRRDDQHPSGKQSGVAFVNALWAGPPWPARRYSLVAPSRANSESLARRLGVGS